jgi:hypothetical protein
MVPDGLRTKRSWQQERTDEVGYFVGCLPQARGRDAPVRGARDADDCADVFGPFGVGERGVRIKHLDPACLVTRVLVLVAGRVLIDGRPRRARLFDALVQRGLVVLDLGDHEGIGGGGQFESFFDSAWHQR